VWNPAPLRCAFLATKLFFMVPPSSVIRLPSYTKNPEKTIGFKKRIKKTPKSAYRPVNIE